MFWPNGGTGPYYSDEDGGELVRNLDDTYTYTSPEQDKYHFDEDGYQTKWESR